MDVMKNDNSTLLHAVCVPFPVHSHVKALMSLAELLCGRGFFITFVNTERFEERLRRNFKNVYGPKFRFLSFPDGLPPPGQWRPSQRGELVVSLQNSGPALERVLRTAGDSGKSGAFPPVTCIVTDSFMSCTHNVAQYLGVPRVVFSPVCAASFISQKHSLFLQSEGHIPVKVNAAKRPERLKINLPGNIPPLWTTDLVSFFREQHTSDSIFPACLYECQVLNNSTDYVLINTFEELEGKDVASALSVNGCPALSIGPLFLPNFLEGKDSNSTLDMPEEDESCLRWLDTQKPGSVLYVSFGTTTVKSQEQLEEIALGLENSHQPFLWVLRANLFQERPAILPEGFKERTMGRSLLVGWTPQVKVLSHDSVGGFLTHCGWNSTLESMSMGVPLIGWPSHSDQFLDCRFAKEVWKVGIDFEDIDVDENRLVSRNEVENAVRSLMQTCDGEALRTRAQELKELARKAVMIGGSSFTNLNTFVHDMEIVAKSRGVNV